MAFGKIVIEHESGEQDIYELENVTTSIGRQAGNDIVLNTSAVSRYHAQLVASEGRMYLVDLGTVNGTFVNDQPIPPESRVELNEGDVVTLGDVRLIFFPRQVRSDISLTPEVEVIEKEGVPFRLYVEEPMQTVSPGARLRLAVVIENLTDQEQTYSVAVGGMDRKWAGANRQQVRLEAHEQTEVTVSVRPPRHTDTKSGVYPLTVTVALNDDPTKALQAVREIDVVGYSGFGMVMKQGNQPELFHIAAQNQGNIPLDIRLGGYNRDKRLRYRFEPTETHLEPGETRQISLTVHDQTGSTDKGPIPFVVVARSLDAAGYQAPLYGIYWPGGPVKARPRDSALTFGLPLIAVGIVAVAGLVIMGLLLTGVLGRIFGGQEPGDEGELTDFGEPTEQATLPGDQPTQIPTVIEPPPASATPTTGLLSSDATATPAQGTPQPTPGPAVIVWFSNEPPPTEFLGPFTLGYFWDVEFQWRLPEGVGVAPIEKLEVRERQTGNVIVTITENLSSSGSYPLPAFELVAKVGWDKHDYSLVVYRTGLTLNERYSSSLDIKPAPCRLIDANVALYRSPETTELLSLPLDGSEIIVLGKYVNPANGQVWLRIAPFRDDSSGQFATALAEANHRWLPLPADAFNTIQCPMGQPINLEAYALIGPEPIP